jgi:hypothetical protein
VDEDIREPSFMDKNAEMRNSCNTHGIASSYRSILVSIGTSQWSQDDAVVASVAESLEFSPTIVTQTRSFSFRLQCLLLLLP